MLGKNKKEKKTEKSEKSEKTGEVSIVTKESVGFTLAVFSVLVLLICFTGSMLFGEFGTAVSSFLFGVFGFMTYVVFLSLLYFSVTLIAGKNFIPGKGMTAAGFAFVAFVGLLIHAVLTADFSVQTYGEYLSACFEAGNKGALACTPFGAFGGLITYPVTAVATSAGTYVLFAACIALFGYLFVNAILVRAGIRVKTVRPKKEKKEAEETQKPVAFEDISNERTPRNAGSYTVTENDSRGAEQTATAYRAENVRESSGTYNYQDVDRQNAQRPSYRYNSSSAQQPYYKENGYGREEPNKEISAYELLYDKKPPEVRTEHAEPRYSLYNHPKENDSANFLRGLENGGADYGKSLLYGPNSGNGDYREKNLMFDASSNFNHRTQTNSSPNLGTSNGTFGRSSETRSNGASYSQIYSREIDNRNNASESPRRVLREEMSASPETGYSMYKKEVFDAPVSRETEETSSTEGRGDERVHEDNEKRSVESNGYGATESCAPFSKSGGDRLFDERDNVSEPIRPTYRAPSEEERGFMPPAPTVRAVEKNDGSFVSEETERPSLRDKFTEDREKQLNERVATVDGKLEFQTRRQENSDREEDFLDADKLFDDDFDTDFKKLNDDGDVADFRIDENRSISSERDRGYDRSREGLSSAIRDRSDEKLSNDRMPSARDARIGNSQVDLTGRGVIVPDGDVVSASERIVPPVPKARVIHDYVRPPLDLFENYADTVAVDMNEIEATKNAIVDTLSGFNIAADIARVTTGPAFTRYDITIPKNVTVKTVARYADNIAMSIHAASAINIYSNFSQGTIVIEVPNRKRSTVGMRTMLQSDAYVNAKPGSLTFCIGKDVEGKAVCGSLTKMTHMLVAGATGSGKSVFLNELIISLIMKYSPEELRLILIDPKQVEFAPYDKLPHLMINEIIADVNKVIVTLNWAINEMEHRYTLFRQLTSAGTAVRNIDEYNAAMSEKTDKLPKIVIIVDELADLMSVAKKDIEDRISRIAAKARAAGIHLVLATQRPSVDVITGVLKSNLPSRFAFRVSAEVDSRVILDDTGAENLLGAGDLLYKTGSMFGVERVQGAWLDSPEIQRVCDYIRRNNEAYYDESVTEFINSGGKTSAEGDAERENDGEVEPVYVDALRYVVQSGSASISMIQRKCSVGYNKAGKIIEWMEMSGYISPFDGAKSRKVLLSADDFRAKYGEL